MLKQIGKLFEFLWTFMCESYDELYFKLGNKKSSWVRKKDGDMVWESQRLTERKRVYRESKTKKKNKRERKKLGGKTEKEFFICTILYTYSIL